MIESATARQIRLDGLSALGSAGHTFGQRIAGKDECPACPGEHGQPGPCDHVRYTRAQRRFIFHPMHYPAVVAAHYNPDRAAAAHEMHRQTECRKDPPRGHMCWCVCPREDLAHAWPPCAPCIRHQANLKAQEPIAMGRTGHVEPPMPTITGLDIALSGLAA